MAEADIAVRVAAEIARRPPAPEPVELDEDDEGRAAALFLALDTQWRWTGSGMVAGNGGFGVRIGLDYTAIAPTAAGLELVVDRRVMLDLRAMEAEALTTFSEARRG